MARSKLTCPKWHFDQVGHGAKNHMRGFLIKIPSLKNCDFL